MIEQYGESCMETMTLDRMINLTENNRWKEPVEEYMKVFGEELVIFLVENKIIQFYTELFDAVHEKVMARLPQFHELRVKLCVDPDTYIFLKKLLNDQIFELINQVQLAIRCK
jgi:hypothetical protein